MEENNFAQAVASFKRTAKITQDVRFEANLRLIRRQRSSSYLISLLSLYVISLSLIPNILELNQSQNQLLLTCSIVLSVFIIFTSLIDGSQNFFHRGELMHQCGRKIAFIYRELRETRFDDNIENAWKQLKVLQEAYRTALNECPVNHDSSDYLKEIARNPDLFPKIYGSRTDLMRRLFFHIRSFCAEYGWIIPHLVALGVISYVVYRFIFLPQS